MKKCLLDRVKEILSLSNENKKAIEVTNQDIISAQQTITDMDIVQIKTEQAITDMDLRLLKLEEVTTDAGNA